MTMTQLNPPLWLWTPKGLALCHLMIDYGIEHDLYWVCFSQNTGECWTWSNRDVRIDKNMTIGRGIPKPFYEPDDVALGSDHLPENEHECDEMEEECPPPILSDEDKAKGWRLTFGNAEM